MQVWLTTTRTTGLFYLGFLVSGIIGYLIPFSNFYVPDNAQTTTANIIANPTLAHIGLIGELGIIAFQVLVALWFFKLFSKVNTFAAVSLLVFGLMGAVSILVGMIFSTQAIRIALEPSALFALDQSSLVLFLWQLHQIAWEIGHLFFGLWLIPMGYLVRQAKMPNILGWLLIIGGVVYILSGVIKIGIPEQNALAEMLANIPSVGEIWMIFYLLLNRGHLNK